MSYECSKVKSIIFPSKTQVEVWSKYSSKVKVAQNCTFPFYSSYFALIVSSQHLNMLLANQAMNVSRNWTHYLGQMI